MNNIDINIESMCELLYELLNDLRLRILRHYEIATKLLQLLNLMRSTQPATQNADFDIFTRKLRKTSCKAFHGETYFI